jgi:hypothetical protein
MSTAAMSIMEKNPLASFIDFTPLSGMRYLARDLKSRRVMEGALSFRTG